MTSRRAWSIALVSSAASNSETTSNDDSAIAGREDGVQSERERHNRERETADGADRQQGADPGGALVEGLHRRPVVRVRTKVEVVQAGLAGPLHQLVEHQLASPGLRLRAEFGDR